ncbi:MAG: phosphomethylpyrimidine synthase ThiC, partial [Clostridium butyricum]
MNYKTQMEAAKKGIVTKEMQVVAEKESMSVEELMKLMAQGKVVIPANVNHKSISPEGIGDGLKTKINVNLGISGDSVDYCREMEKVKLAIEYGAEAIMDLS